MSLRKNLDDLKTNGQKGDWAFIENDTRIAIRYGENALSGMTIIPISDKGWQWNGNKDAPTLTPSILVKPYPKWTEGWHGFLTDGKLVTI